MPRKSALLIAIIATLQFGAGTAHTEPGFAETREWITEKINRNKTHFYSAPNTSLMRDVFNLQIEECTIYYEEHAQLMRNDVSSTWVLKTKFEFADVEEYNYHNETSSGPSFYIKTYTNNIILNNDNSRNGAYSKLDNSAYLYVDLSSEPDLPARMIKAFMHLTKLAQQNPDCPKRVRAKSDLF